MRFHKPKRKKYGLLDFVLDAVTLPLVILFWVVEKIFNCADRI